jgi:hypothetical protein
MMLYPCIFSTFILLELTICFHSPPCNVNSFHHTRHFYTIFGECTKTFLMLSQTPTFWKPLGLHRQGVCVQWPCCRCCVAHMQLASALLLPTVVTGITLLDWYTFQQHVFITHIDPDGRNSLKSWSLAKHWCGSLPEKILVHSFAMKGSNLTYVAPRPVDYHNFLICYDSRGRRR